MLKLTRLTGRVQSYCAIGPSSSSDSEALALFGNSDPGFCPDDTGRVVSSWRLAFLSIGFRARKMPKTLSLKIILTDPPSLRD